jgi:cytochrome c heme-lyase
MLSGCRIAYANDDNKNTPSNTASTPHAAVPTPHGDMPAGAKCPVDHKAMNKFVEVAKEQEARQLASLSTQASGSGAAVAAATGSDARDKPEISTPKAKSATTASAPEVYDVYARKVDPNNMMPANPNQLPVAGQDAPLPQDRVKSSIPKGGTDTTWSYPSPQIFYNSLVRKEKSDGIKAKEVELVVAIHNNMNEHAWREVLRWEALHADECTQPKLLKFTGRPHDLSPLARVRSWLGYGTPFDRHDWTVDRNGRQVRYVLDYYHFDSAAQLARLGVASASGGESGAGASTIALDVRPAIDSFDALLDRARVWLGRRLRVATSRVGGFSSPPDVLTSSLARSLTAEPPPARLRVRDDAEFQRLASLDATRVRAMGAQFEARCASAFAGVQAAVNEGDSDALRNANTDLRVCMADIVCPSQVSEAFLLCAGDLFVAGQCVSESIAWQE